MLTTPVQFQSTAPQAKTGATKAVNPATTTTGSDSVKFGSNAEAPQQKSWKETITDAVKSFFQQIWDTVKENFQQIWNNLLDQIKGAFSSKSEPQQTASAGNGADAASPNDTPAAADTTEAAAGAPKADNNSQETYAKYVTLADERATNTPDAQAHIYGTLSARLALAQNGADSPDVLAKEIDTVNEILAGNRDDLLLLDKRADGQNGPSDAEKTGLEAYKNLLEAQKQ